VFVLQHASRDVEKMILGNKCDMNDKRQVSKDRGEQVCNIEIMTSLMTGQQGLLETGGYYRNNDLADDRSARTAENRCVI